VEYKTKYIAITKHARYAEFGNLSDKTKYFWFALHGSKMLCEQMIFKFKDFDPQEHYIVAPEALSRFYLEGFGGDVVATWMTSRDRLYEIQDFSNYLTDLYQSIGEQLPKDCQKIILSFSQGVTTSFRWLHASKIDADTLIAYSGWIPEDIDLTESKTSLVDIDILYTHGKSDKFLTENRIKVLKGIISKNKLDIPVIAYEGGHKIDRSHLLNLFNKHIKK
jgi:predicted esterase